MGWEEGQREEEEQGAPGGGGGERGGGGEPNRTLAQVPPGGQSPKAPTPPWTPGVRTNPDRSRPGPPCYGAPSFGTRSRSHLRRWMRLRQDDASCATLMREWAGQDDRVKDMFLFFYSHSFCRSAPMPHTPHAMQATPKERAERLRRTVHEQASHAEPGLTRTTKVKKARRPTRDTPTADTEGSPYFALGEGRSSKLS